MVVLRAAMLDFHLVPMWAGSKVMLMAWRWVDLKAVYLAALKDTPLVGL